MVTNEWKHNHIPPNTMVVMTPAEFALWQAAPDLLKACEKLVANFPKDWPSLDAARAAIAKAKS